MRKLIFPENKPKFLEAVAWWFWTKNRTSSPSIGRNILTKKNFLVYFPTKYKDKMCCYFSYFTKKIIGDKPDKRKSEILRLFSDIKGTVPSVLKSIPPSNEIYFQQLLQINLKKWHKGNILLIGDAAHSISPLAGMGGSLALEDAYVLSDELSKNNSIKNILNNFQSRRYDRTEFMKQNFTQEDFLE